MNAIILVFALGQPETLPPPLLPTSTLIADLGGAYAKRVAATKTLRAMGEDARSALQKAATGDDLEISRRAQTLLYSLNQDRRRRAMAMIDQAFPTLPYIDCLWYQDNCFKHEGTLYSALWPYYEIADDEPDRMEKGWGKYRRATRLALYDMAEAGVPLWMIRELVQMGWNAELAYWKVGQ